VAGSNSFLVPFNELQKSINLKLMSLSLCLVFSRVSLHKKRLFFILTQISIQRIAERPLVLITAPESGDRIGHILLCLSRMVFVGCVFEFM
jgi:hypothetical protein